MVFDPAASRVHFPALARKIHGRPALFFDNPAGTQVPQATIDGFSQYFQHANANVGGAFATSQATGEIIDAARAGMAEFLHASSPTEIAFGPNMTSLTFDVARALGEILQAGDEIVTTRLEHDANVSPWLSLQSRGVQVRYIDIHPEDTTLNWASAEATITARTRLVAAGYASNAFGTVNDIRRLAMLAHAAGAWLFVDAVHYAPHGSIDVATLDCDLLVCSSYKFFGPHLGILWGRQAVLDALPAQHVRPAGDQSPGKWETGTGSYESFAGLLGTLDYLRGRTAAGTLQSAMEAIHAYERTLTDHLIPGLLRIPGVTVYGITDPDEFDRRVPTVSFLLGDRDPVAVAEELGQAGIFSWAGDHYAVEPLARLGLSMTNRIGLAHYNTIGEIDSFLTTVESVAAG